MKEKSNKFYFSEIKFCSLKDNFERVNGNPCIWRSYLQFK